MKKLLFYETPCSILHSDVVIWRQEDSVAHHKFWLLENYDKMFFMSENFCPKMQNFVLTTKYTVSQKNIPDILDCNLKTNYQILIIFGKNILDTTWLQMTVQFSTSPNVAFAIPRESRSSEICVEINRKPEKNIPDIIDCNLKKISRF